MPSPTSSKQKRSAELSKVSECPSTRADSSPATSPSTPTSSSPSSSKRCDQRSSRTARTSPSPSLSSRSSPASTPSQPSSYEKRSQRTLRSSGLLASQVQVSAKEWTLATHRDHRDHVSNGSD